MNKETKNNIEATATVVYPGEKLVTIRIPKSRDEEGDVFVSVNDRTWLIQRGVSVEVPECVLEVLQAREERIDAAISYEQEQQNRTKNKNE